MQAKANIQSETAKMYRPAVHFTPEHSWTNDPNGMILIDGQYHLFYQNNPYAAVWGPMYWGHAVSRDLLHWHHLPTAIEPDKLGVAFSGCCVLDRNNVSGLGTKEKPALIAIYTSHNLENHTESQSLSYSTDYVHFAGYAGNPVIKNPGIPNFRDPKIFYSPDGDGFCLVVSAHDRVLFYHSRNLTDWEETGAFLMGRHGLSGIAECPDCFPLKLRNGGEEITKWILIVSMITNPDTPEAGHQTQYFIGDFDGRTFTDTENAAGPLLLNYGMDYYAAVSFMDTEKRLLLGWADNWTYANKTPERDYRGQMSLAAEAELLRTARGLRLALTPAGTAESEKAAVSFTGHTKPETQSFGLKIHGKGDIRIRIGNNGAAADVFNGDMQPDPPEEFVLAVTDGRIRADRTKAGRSDFEEHFLLPENSIAEVQRYTDGAYDIRLYFDKSLVEIFAEDGLIPITMSVYPRHPYTDITVDGDAACSIFTLE